MTQKKFRVYGEPKGKGRPKFSTVNGHVNARTPKETVSYENLVKTEYRLQCDNYRFPDDAELAIHVFAYFSIPKSTSKKRREAMSSKNILPIKKPDVDNILKIVADSLNGIAYRDDAQIATAFVRKIYSEQPYISVTIKEIDHVD